MTKLDKLVFNYIATIINGRDYSFKSLDEIKQKITDDIEIEDEVTLKQLSAGVTDYEFLRNVLIEVCELVNWDLILEDLRKQFGWGIKF